MKTFYLFLLLAGISQLSLAQYSISGKVLDDDALPLLGVDIYIDELHIGTTSDESGNYLLSNIPKGAHRLTFSYFGFNTENRDVFIDSEDLTIDLQLTPSLFHMDEVIVSAPFQKLQSENVMKIEYRTLASLKKAGTPTLMQSITAIPGVSEASTGNGIGKPVIRGLSGNRVLVYTQGVRLENQQFGSEHGLGLNGAGIESVEVIKGPASLLYGSDALGGVLYLNPEKFAYQNKTKIGLEQSFFSNTLGSNTSLGVKTSGKKLKLLARGSLNLHSDYKIPDGDRVTNTRFRESDFKAGLGLNLENYVTELRYNFNRSEIGITEGIGEQSDSKTVEEPYQDLSTHIVSLHNHFFMNRSKLDVDLGYILNVRKEFEAHEHEELPGLDEEEHGEEAALNMNLSTLTYDVKYHLPKSEKWEGIFGLQGLYQVNENSGEEILIPDATIKDIGLLFTSRYMPGANHSIQGGIRYDYRSLNTKAYETGHHEEESHEEETELVEAVDRNFGNFTFSLGYKTTLWKHIPVRLNLASGFRAPNLAELTSYGVHHGSNRFEVGNPDLESEQNIQADISLEYANEHVEVYANGFYNHLNSYIYAAPTGESEEGFPIYAYVQNDARLYGGEFGLHFHPHPLDWLHLESNLETVIGKLENDEYLPLIPANRWSNTIRSEFKGNKRFNDIHIAVNLDSYFRQDKVSEFETETPGYNLLNLRFGGRLSFTNWQVNINMSVNNLFDETYVSHLSSLKYLNIPNPGRNVVLGLNFEFL